MSEIDESSGMSKYTEYMKAVYKSACIKGAKEIEVKIDGETVLVIGLDWNV